MNKDQKKAVVAEFEALFETAKAVFLLEYKGLNVSDLQSFRRALRKDDGLFRVTKARLMKIAAKNKANVVTSLTDFQDMFREQVGIVFSQSDEVPSVAKKIVEFAKENENLKILSGVFEDKILQEDGIKQLASIPSREVLIAMLLGTMQAPITSFVRLLNQLIARLLYVLKEIEKQKSAV